MRHTTKGPRFRSPLKSDIAALIEQKRAVGFEYQDMEKQLQRLDRFLVESRLRRRALPRRLVLAWIRKRPEEAPATQWNRIICVRQLALLLVRRGVPAFVAPSGMRAVRGAVGSRSFAPCVLTREEVGRILAVAHEVPSKVHNIGPYRHLVMPELFRVLFCCGLRIGEALKLRVQDVDLQHGIITVRRGKFRRDRLVPMAPALTQRLRVYARRMGARGPERPFFVSRTGDFLAYDTAREVFIEMLGRAEIACEGPRWPTLHSARHTFASHRLQEWYRTGQDLDVWLPVLTTYLGHCQVWGTHRYLHVTPEILPTIIENHENRFGKAIPVLRAP
jgi:integrase/recombinase XerD